MMNQRASLCLIFLSFLLLSACKTEIPEGPLSRVEGNSEYRPDYTQWSSYLGDPGRNHYTTLSQITPENVDELKVAWTYSSPDSGEVQMNPIIKDGVLYGVTAGLRAIALDAATGGEIWRFGDPENEWYSVCRGVSYWSEGADARILYTLGSFLYALDAKTGKVIESFGDKGRVDLHEGLPAIAKNKFIISSTPGTIFENLIIMPVRVSEGSDAAPGDIRAFDVKTGKLAWTFHTIPYPHEAGYETWLNKDAYKNIDIGAVNNWAGMAVDLQSGIIFIPTGSAAPDFYGGNRRGRNLYSDCLLALNAATGELIWHYQFVHHDIWDRDMPAPPNLILVERDGEKIEAVAQITKQGYVFVFERKTGKPLFEIKQEKFPPSNLEGEYAWPTQPIPVSPKPFARLSTELTEKDISPYAENKAELLQIFKESDKGLFVPPDTTPVFLFPGYDGGAEWGGAAADPEEGIIYVNANEMAWILKMEKVINDASISLGESLYITNCASCHQKDMRGFPQSGFPSLIDISKKMKKEEIGKQITHGKGMMIGFSQLSPEEKGAIIDFIYGEDKKEISATATESTSSKELYRFTGYHKFLDSNGLPGISPPWGTMHAINLNNGEFLWSITLGETLSLKEKGYPITGSENYGGPVVTENGLLFIAATKDGYFRAYNKKTGELLWKTQLPAAAFATPSTYSVNGKQYIVIACGGEKLGAKKGNKIVAFALE